MDRRGSTCPSITKSFEGANYLSMMALTLSRSCLLIPSPAANWNTLFLFSLGLKKYLKTDHWSFQDVTCLTDLDRHDRTQT